MTFGLRAFRVRKEHMGNEIIINGRNPNGPTPTPSSQSINQQLIYYHMITRERIDTPRFSHEQG